MKKPLLNFETKYKLCLHKSYFDKGENLLSYVKWIILFYGFSSSNVFWTVLLGITWGLTSYLLGFFWFKTDFFKAECEVGNKNNLLAIEIRKSLKKNSLSQKKKMG